MASNAQLFANRANARKSTGPTTPEGKQRSARNSLRHGFNSRDFIVPDDQREEFEAFCADLREELEPRGAFAENLFLQLLHAAWNLRRVHRAEAELFDGVTDPLSNPDLHHRLELLGRYQARHERSYHRFRKALAEHQTNLVAHANGLPLLDQQNYPVLTDVHSVHRSRKNATAVYDPSELQSTSKCERWAAEGRYVEALKRSGQHAAEQAAAGSA